MARVGVPITETITLTQLDAAAAGQAIVHAMGTGGVYQSAGVTAGVFQFTRVFRPQWALVWGWILTIGLCGGGFWFFLIKKTETCTITITEDATGVRATVNGRILPETLLALRRVLGGASAEVIEATPSVSAMGAGGMVLDPSLGVPVKVASLGAPAPSPLPVALAPLATPVERPLTSAHPLATPNVTTSPPPLVATDAALADHTVVLPATGAVSGSPSTLFIAPSTTVPLDGPALVGRAPSAMKPGDEAFLLVSVADPDFTVSKTHFAVGVDGGSVWVEDRHSTNGTSIGTDRGAARRLAAGERVTVTPGSRIWFGDREAEIR